MPTPLGELVENRFTIKLNEILGTEKSEEIFGTSGSDRIQGGLGSDILRGGNGDDLLIGYLIYEDSKSSKETINGLTRFDLDTLFGGQGDDLYIIDSWITNIPAIVELPNEGIDTIFGGAAKYTLPANVENYVNDLSLTNNGSALHVVITGNELDNGISTFSWASKSAEHFIGGDGNDTMVGGGGDDILDGGNGFDTAVFYGLRSEYTITDLGSGVFRVVDSITSRDGTDTLLSMERLQFSDLSIDLVTGATRNPVNGHYYQAVSDNVTWETAFSLSNDASYRGLKGYLATITSSDEDRFVHYEVVNNSGITGWGSFAGYQGTWLGGSDKDQEGTWKWMNGPESGQVFAVSTRSGSINSSIGGYSNFLAAVHEGNARVDFDYLVSQVPRTPTSVPSGWINGLFWDDVPANIGSADIREYGAADYGIGNGYVIEYGGLPTSHRLEVSESAVDEGSSITFDVFTTNVEWGSILVYSITGISLNDLSSGSLSGPLIVQERGKDGGASITFHIAADNLTEGPETLTLTVAGVSASVLINDTSTGIITPALPVGRVETKAYSVSSAQASVRSNDGGTTWTVTTPSGMETLTSFDRLRFSDKTIALDFDRGEAGHKTVTMIGAAFGKGFVSQYFGTGLSLFDSGQTVAQIAQLVVSTGLIESMVGSSNSAWVRHVYKNVVGVNPDAFTEAIYRTYLDNGTYTKASLLELAAGVEALEAQIDLVGIRAEGIGYAPFL